MSSALYSTRLYAHSGTVRVAKLHGVYVSATTERLVLAGTPMERCDYVPEIGLAHCLPERGEPRDMTPDEIRAADELLRAVHQPATDRSQP